MEYTFKAKAGMLNICSLLLVFAGIFIFFQSAHPLVPWDGDDWATLSSYNRHAYPTWGSWNPIRIFPEIFGPLVGYFAAYVIYPLQGDYVQSITLSVSLALALFITGFYYTLYRVFFSLTKNNILAILSGFLVIVLYFLIFKSKEYNNYYMFWPYNLCTTFYYVLPNIINSSLVCYFLSKRLNNENITLTDGSMYRYGLLVVILYFAVFSMLWGNSILAVYIFFEIVFGAFGKGIKNYWNENLKHNKVYLIVLALFAIYCIFEFFGGRSAYLQNTQGAGLSNSFNNFKRLAGEMESLFILFSVSSLAVAVLIRVLKKQNDAAFKLVGQFLICMVSISVFYLIACARAGADFASRIESVYGTYFFMILAAVFSFVYILSKYPKAFIVLPLILSVMFLETTRASKPYSVGIWTDTSALQKYNYMNSWIAQVKKADRKGETSVTIKYPANLGVWFGAMSQALYAHNIITKPIEIKAEKVN